MSMLAVLVAFAFVAAAAVLMQQTLTPPAGTANPLTANCPAPSGSAAVTGSSGAQVFTCGASAAFTVASGGATTTPSFATLVAPYTALWIYPSGSPVSSASCFAITSSVQILSGGQQVLAAGSYSYCADYANYPSTAPGTIVVSWS